MRHRMKGFKVLMTNNSFVLLGTWYPPCNSVCKVEQTRLSKPFESVCCFSLASEKQQTDAVSNLKFESLRCCSQSYDSGSLIGTAGPPSAEGLHLGN